MQGGAPRTICIVSPGCSLVEEALLEGAGYRLRKATSAGGPVSAKAQGRTPAREPVRLAVGVMHASYLPSLQDLLFSCGSTTVACLLLLHPSAEEWAR